MSTESELTETPEKSLSVKDLLDKYSDSRRAAQKAAFALCVVSVVLAAFSRSPSWVLKAPFDFLASRAPKVETPGLSSGFMPIFGPAVTLVLVGAFFGALVETLGLRSGTCKRLKAAGFRRGSPEWELARPPLRSSLADEIHITTRIGTTINLLFLILVPSACYWMLLWDFWNLKLSDETLQRGYQLLYHWRGGAVAVASHRDVGGGLPPIYSWLAWANTLGLLAVIAALLVAVAKVTNTINSIDAYRRFWFWLRNGPSTAQDETVQKSMPALPPRSIER
jgi:hypothetical protein